MQVHLFQNQNDPRTTTDPHKSTSGGERAPEWPYRGQQRFAPPPPPRASGPCPPTNRKKGDSLSLVGEKEDLSCGPTCSTSFERKGVPVQLQSDVANCCIKTMQWKRNSFHISNCSQKHGAGGGRGGCPHLLVQNFIGFMPLVSHGFTHQSVKRKKILKHWITKRRMYQIF